MGIAWPGTIASETSSRGQKPSANGIANRLDATTVNKYRVWRSFGYCVETAQRVQFYMAYIERCSLEFPLIVVKQDDHVKSFSLSLSSRFRVFFFF